MTIEQRKYLREQIDEYAHWVMVFFEQESNKVELFNLIEKNLFNNKSTSQLVSDLGHYHGHWNIDWLYVATVIHSDFYSFKRVFERINSNMLDKNLIVYKLLGESACYESRELYLKNPNDINSEPIKFNVIQLLNNYSNLNKPRENWLPVVGNTNFGLFKNFEECEYFDKYEVIFCRNHNEIWNKNNREFEPTKKNQRERKERLKFIKTTITNKDGEVVSKLENNSTISVKIDAKNYKRVLGEQKAKQNLFQKMLRYLKK